MFIGIQHNVMMLLRNNKYLESEFHFICIINLPVWAGNKIDWSELWIFISKSFETLISVLQMMLFPKTHVEWFCFQRQNYAINLYKVTLVDFQNWWLTGTQKLMILLPPSPLRKNRDKHGPRCLTESSQLFAES